MVSGGLYLFLNLTNSFMHQSIPIIFFGLIFLATTTTFIWARIFYFSSSKNKFSILYLYDLLATFHIGMSIYCYYSYINIPLIRIWIAIIFIFLSLALFIWTTNHARGARIALNYKTKSLHTRGPYSMVRHPFYLSYILAWTSTTVLFNSFTLWITLSFLMAFYITIAHKEEKAISRGALAAEYKNYSKHAGMFLPRINRWKN